LHRAVEAGLGCYLFLERLKALLTYFDAMLGCRKLERLRGLTSHYAVHDELSVCGLPLHTDFCQYRLEPREHREFTPWIGEYRANPILITGRAQYDLMRDSRGQIDLGRRTTQVRSRDCRVGA